MPAEVHVLPVPHGMSIEDAWAETVVLGGFAHYRRWKPRFWKMPWVIIHVPEDADPLTEFEILPADYET